MIKDIQIEHNSDIHKRIDELELEMLSNFSEAECPLSHTFTPGLYTREIFMPKDSLITSQIHNTIHPFVISKGAAYVKINDDDWELLEAPYRGTTFPGTRRVLAILEDCIWTTFHPTDIEPENHSEEAILEAVKKVQETIIEKHDNPLLEEFIIKELNIES